MSEILEENALAGTLEYKPSFERDERQKTGWITDMGAAITENLQLSKPGNQIGLGHNLAADKNKRKMLIVRQIHGFKVHPLHFVVRQTQAHHQVFVVSQHFADVLGQQVPIFLNHEFEKIFL